MNHPFLRDVIAGSLVAAGAAMAQPPTRSVADEIEAIVTVTEVDPAKRTVTVKGPRGESRTLVIPQAKNLDQVKPGDRFKILYTEALAVGFGKSGEQPSASVGESVEPAPRGATPGGMATRVAEVTGVIDAIDHKNRYLTVSGPQGNPVSVKVPDDVRDFDRLSAGDNITLTYVQALAIDMVPEAGEEKPK
jgi:hypothetical protein